MSSSNSHNKPKRAAKIAASRALPADKFDVDPKASAMRAEGLQVLQRRFQRLDQYYDDAVTEIRATLVRAS